MKKLETTIGFLLILLSLCLDAQAAEYYTWVDENGVVNFSERDPEEYDAELVNSRNKQPRAFGYRRARTSEPESQETRQSPSESEAFGEDGSGLDPEIDAQIAAEKARMQEEIAKVKRSNCAIGKRNLAQLETYSRVRVQDDDGGERVLTDAERADRIAQARKTIRENCTT